MKIKLYTLILISALVQIPFAANAIKYGGEKEMMSYFNSLNSLPEFCRYKMTAAEFRSNRTAWPEEFENKLNQWVNRLGQLNWTYIHHYCYGVRAINEYVVMDIKEKETFGKKKLERALREFQFMRNSNAKHVFPFWNEVYSYEGFIHYRLGE